MRKRSKIKEGVKMLESYKAYLLEGEKSELTVEKYLRDVTKFLT